jgi:hypothetical protein
MLTRGELKSLFSYMVDDLSFGYFTETQVNMWLNLAQKEVQKLLLQAGENFYMVPVETVTVGNQADYALPNDFMKLHRLELVLSGSGVSEDRMMLFPITLNQQGVLGNANSNPVGYSMGKDRFTLYPTPDSAKTLRLYYSPRVTDMTADADEPDCPDEYAELLAIMAAEYAFIKDDRTPSSLLEKKRSYLELMKQTSEDRKEDVPRPVVMIDDESFGSSIY